MEAWESTQGYLRSQKVIAEPWENPYRLRDEALHAGIRAILGMTEGTQGCVRPQRSAGDWRQVVMYNVRVDEVAMEANEVWWSPRASNP